MVWFDTLEELQYYNQPVNGDCYCDLMVEANDLILQANVPAPGIGQYTVLIEVLSADGLTVYEDATQYFDWVAIQGINGQYYINIRANRFSPQMCVRSCFILRVTVSRKIFHDITHPSFVSQVIFKKYTERYCVDNCCMVATDVDVDVIDPNGEYDERDYGDEYFNIP